MECTQDYDDILDYLRADIIDFQEVKSTRSALTKPVAVPPSYDFFSFPQHSLQQNPGTQKLLHTYVPEPLYWRKQRKDLVSQAVQTHRPESYPDSRGVIVVDGEDVVIDKDEGTSNQETK
ncbi:Class II abasic (AP) endonuclease, partial [Marasmius sp. AFHP31]